MKKRTERKLTDELRREYDLSKLKGVRGKYATCYQAGTNLVLLSPRTSLSISVTSNPSIRPYAN
jgi:hypothetical protein